VGAAFLIELTCYASIGTRLLSSWWQRLASVLAPYLLYSLATGVFSWKGAAILTLLGGAASGWLRWLSPRWDAGFFALWGIAYLTKAVHEPYVGPMEGLRVDALAQLMWFRTCAHAVLTDRTSPGHDFAFLPGRRHWEIGFRYFACFAPIGLLLSLATGFAGFRLVPGFWWKAPATFFGILWVVALGEEVLFRGLLQDLLARRFGPWPAIAAVSVLFGAGHLWFGSRFPNWKFALLACAASFFYGRAYLAAGSLRASMVAHALTVTLWRTFLG